MEVLQKGTVSGESPKTMKKLCHSAKFPHQEIRWNYGILRRVRSLKFGILMTFIWLMIMKMMLKINVRSRRYDINWLRPRNGHKYTKYKTCLRMMMVILIKQHLSNIWSSVHEKVKQHWGWSEKKCCFSKKRVGAFFPWGDNNPVDIIIGRDVPYHI